MQNNQFNGNEGGSMHEHYRIALLHKRELSVVTIM